MRSDKQLNHADSLRMLQLSMIRGTQTASNAPYMPGHKPNLMTVSLLAMAVPALGLSSLSTWSAGLAWLFISLAGGMAWVSQNTRPPEINASANSALVAAHGWLMACLVAFVLMAIGTAYWGGPWSERPPQWRLMIGALGLWALLRYSPPSRLMVQALATAAGVASLLAYGLVVTSGSSEAPTNRIPWMAGLTLLSCALLSLSYSLRDTAFKLRQFWLTASALMLLTALLSGVRGSWPLLLVWPLMFWRLNGSGHRLWSRSWKWLLPLLALLMAVGLQRVPESDNPITRITALWQETASANHKEPVSLDTSSGVRAALYRTAIAHTLDQPWLGLGPSSTKALIKEELNRIGATYHFHVVGHMHNDLLQPWLEFGLLGLAAYLAYAAGLAIAAWRLCGSLESRNVSTGLVGLLVMHLCTGMTNMNFAHNYYPVMLALSTALVMLGNFSESLRPTRR